MAFGGKGWKAGGKTRKIRPSGDDLCSFRHAAGRSVQDCGKVVQKLAGREDENHKLCTTLCAPLRLGTRIVQVSFPLGVRCVGVVVRRCAIRSFSLPPAEAGCPFRRRGRGGRLAGAGRAHEQRRVAVQGGVRLCLRPPPPCARRRGTRWHNGADSFPERRGHSPGAADERTIYYIYACAGARRERFAQGGEQRCG